MGAEGKRRGMVRGTQGTWTFTAEQSRCNTSFLEARVLQLRESAGFRNVAVTVFWNGISEGGAMASLSDPAFSQPKEDLISAPSKDDYAAWMRWFENEVAKKYETAGGGLDIIADVLQQEFEEPVHFDLIQNRNLDNGLIAVGEQREQLRSYLQQLAVRMGLRHPDIAACAAVLVIEQAIVRTRMTGSPDEAQTARLLLQCLRHA
jgi:hypothetical protein